MAVILPVLAACGLAAGAAWAGEPIAHTPALPPDGVFAYELLPLPEPAPLPARAPAPELPVHADATDDPSGAALEAWIDRTAPARPPMPPALPPEPLETLLEELAYRSFAAMLAATESVPEPVPYTEPLPVRSVSELTRGEPGVHRWPVVKVIDGNTIKCQVCASV